MSFPLRSGRWTPRRAAGQLATLLAGAAPGDRVRVPRLLRLLDRSGGALARRVLQHLRRQPLARLAGGRRSRCPEPPPRPQQRPTDGPGRAPARCAGDQECLAPGLRHRHQERRCPPAPVRDPLGSRLPQLHADRFVYAVIGIDDSNCSIFSAAQERAAILHRRRMTALVKYAFPAVKLRGHVLNVGGWGAPIMGSACAPLPPSDFGLRNETVVFAYDYLTDGTTACAQLGNPLPTEADANASMILADLAGMIDTLSQTKTGPPPSSSSRRPTTPSPAWRSRTTT